MRMKLLILSIIGSAGFSVADDAVLFGNVIETDWILTPEGVTNAILTTALTVEADPVAFPVATNALATATNALALAEGALQAEADTLATVTARGATTTNAVTIGSRGAGAVGVSSLANGANVVASGDNSHAQGNSTTASGNHSHASGFYATASGYASHAEGFGAKASGDYSHAEGLGTTASGEYSHAEGTSTTASGDVSHAEGIGTTASGNHSHASGFNSSASHVTSFSWQGSDGGYNESPYGSHGPGTYNLNPVGGLAGLWIGETNMATTLSGYATTGAVAAVQAEVGAKADAETVVSGAVCVATAGNRYFWTSATNVVLSVNLASGQVVNLAKLNNTGTNSITAIGAVGWEWTGGEMTNTIAAGKSMTFGFLVDAATGVTNAYATGVSK